MKRFTYWPQLFLGFTFNYGLIMAWFSIKPEFSYIPIIFYMGAIFWTLAYDTIYGFQDIKDDEIIGVKSTSIKFKKNIPIIFPMAREDFDPDEIWSNAVEKIVKFIQNGESVVLLCLGDTSLFASSSNILRLIKNNHAEIFTKTIPGISSISAAAALNDFDLAKKGETLIIKECSSSESELITLIRESKANKTVLAIMKVGKRWNLVREILKKEDIINTTLIALSIGMPDQIIQHASQYKKEFMPYFSLILIRFD